MMRHLPNAHLWRRSVPHLRCVRCRYRDMLLRMKWTRTHFTRHTPALAQRTGNTVRPSNGQLSTIYTMTTRPNFRIHAPWHRPTTLLYSSVITTAMVLDVKSKRRKRSRLDERITEIEKDLERLEVVEVSGNEFQTTNELNETPSQPQRGRAKTDSSQLCYDPSLKHKSGKSHLSRTPKLQYHYTR